MLANQDYTAPEFERSALVLIDVQNDFLDDGAAPVEGTAGRIDVMARLAAMFRAAGRPIVHIVRLYVPGGSDVDLLRRAAIEAGDQVAAPHTHGAHIPESILPDTSGELDFELLLAGGTQHLGTNEVVMFKPRWSAFYRTDLDHHLRDRDVTTIVLAGCNLPNCPRATLFDASERDYRAVLVTDATSQVTSQRLSDLQLIGVHLATAADIEEWFKADSDLATTQSANCVIRDMI
ncbi:cysteine hydrolase family protein [Mycobacterium sp.]|uniref:cysteine hydrolase family protein n=1 Tax=Mycobacterium sp. TaxID=1785 RepID=UPI003C7660DA